MNNLKTKGKSTMNIENVDARMRIKLNGKNFEDVDFGKFAELWDKR